ncbi:transporter [Pyxidicoccus sp. MSG2]|uniref:transporter n=1 Tax=Pyxidicoccus sp. MSG2 TaxID=2996790 RepID=UPI00226DA91A|nr:transporter [Pyxidicoccus sp. MSG2]MCY1021106.1 transporter [Pyxidicoccus sp. MSG2]
MMPKNDFCTGFMYTHEQWSSYWEGELKRDNENIGRLTTRNLMWIGNYGLHDRVNVIAAVPYVWTRASQGTLHGMEGLQDFSLAVKGNFFKQQFEGGWFNAFAGAAFSMPMSDYAPDFYPLSLGTSTYNLSGRLTASLRLAQGWYLTGSGAYTWRSNTSLDRAAYYTDGQLFLTDDVQMPDMVDFVASVGYLQNGLQVELHYLRQNTLGGGDIRRQDMPFVSNRMNFSKVGAMISYFLPGLSGLALRGGADLTVSGRNVGASTALTAGLLYTFHLSSNAGNPGSP